MAREAFIIGLGHIGSSLACRLSKKGYKVFGTDVVPSRVTYCAKRHWIKPVAELPSSGVCVIAVPESQAQSAFVLAQLKRLPKDWVVTEVFSSKGGATSQLEKTCKSLKLVFAWSHPMAGREGSGPESCDASIFNGAAVLIDQRSVKKSAARAAVALANLWRDAGGKPEFISTEKHQLSLGWGSHLTHVVAYALATTAGKRARISPSVLGATRVAASDPKIWTEILASNRAHAASALSALQKELGAYQKALKAKSPTVLKRLLSKGQASRRELSKRAKGRDL